MAYKKLDMYTLTDNVDLIQELYDIIIERGEISATKTKRMIVNPPTMSKIRWDRWMTFKEMDKYLVAVDKDGNKVVEETEEEIDF